MEQVVEVARVLREEHDFRGYIHLKTIPDASARAARRGPAATPTGSASTSSCRPRQAWRRWRRRRTARRSARSMARLRVHIDDAQGRSARRGRRIVARADGAPQRAQPPRFAPAGQSTQMIVGADATDDAHDPRDQRRALRRLPPEARLLLRLQPDPRCGPRPAAAGAAAGARAPPLPGRLADALLRLRRTTRSCAGATAACCRSTSIPSWPGRWRTASASRSTSTARRARCCCACPASACKAVDAHAAGAPRAAPARRRPRAAARAAEQGAALRRARRPPARRARPRDWRNGALAAPGALLASRPPLF